MKTIIQKIVVALLLTAALSLLTACGSTRSENGVTIEESGFLGFF
jgi:outer membrane lipopolysaccharide assembly protein LptE/RlpB